MRTILTKKSKMKSAIALAIICIMVLLSLPLPSYAESSTIEIVGKKYSFEKDDDYSIKLCRDYLQSELLHPLLIIYKRTSLCEALSQ